MTLAWRIAAATVAFAPVIAYFAFRSHLTTMYVTVDGHFVTVAGSSLAAAAISVLITRAAVRRNDIRAGLVGLAFTMMAGLLAIHGLSTPGFILEEYGRNAVIGLAGALAVPAGGVIMALAVIAPPNLPQGRTWIVRGQIAAIALLVTFGIVGLSHPELIPQVPVMVHPWVRVELIPTAILYALVANHALRTFRLTRRRADLWVSIGMVWLGSSIVIYLLSGVWTIGFWGAHTLEALGFVSVAGAVAVDLGRQRPSNMLFERLGGSDLIESEETLLGGYVRALTAELEEHDPSTGRHSRRVAMLSVRMAEHMGLPPHRVRRLAIAGLVHDIGKLHELRWGTSFDYTLEGQLVGHITMGIGMVEKKLAMLPDFPGPLRVLVEHIILSHHGKYEFGSPKLPMIPEALLLHYLDDLDAKMQTMRNEFTRAEAQGRAPGQMTDWVRSMERPLLNSAGYLAVQQQPVELESAKLQPEEANVLPFED